jgi:hypothetical protein
MIFFYCRWHLWLNPDTMLSFFLFSFIVPVNFLERHVSEKVSLRHNSIARMLALIILNMYVLMYV